MSCLGSLLVVDDTEFNRDVLARRLIQRGFSVDTAADGAEALERVSTGRYDLVLLDIEMPVMSGLEVLTRLRETHSQTELPVIMVTGRVASADIVEALGLGANDYVTKPIDFPVALARINTHLSHKWAVADLQESEERYAVAVRGANDGLWDWNIATNEVYWSPRWKSLLGYDEHEIGSDPDEWLSRLHEDDAQRVKDTLNAYLESGTRPLRKRASDPSSQRHISLDALPRRRRDGSGRPRHAARGIADRHHGRKDGRCADRASEPASLYRCARARHQARPSAAATTSSRFSSSASTGSRCSIRASAC